MVAILVLALAASFYVIYVARDPQAAPLPLPAGRRDRCAERFAEAVDREVEHELETGQFREPNPETGEFEAVDPPRLSEPFSR